MKDGYMRIWMELQPHNRLFYIGYATMTGIAGFTMGAAVRYVQHFSF